MRILADSLPPPASREPADEGFNLHQDQRIAQFIESAPMVGDGSVSDSDVLALMKMGSGLVRLAAFAGLTGSSVLQGIAFAWERDSVTPRDDKIAALFNLAAALGYAGTYSLDALANWIDEQTKAYESQIDPQSR
jgi:hypothetical protein